MKCLICHKLVKSGEYILWVSPVIFRGPEDGNVVHVEPPDGFHPAIHSECLEKPVEAAINSNGLVSEDDSGPKVQRSGAINMLSNLRDNDGWS